MSIDQPNIAGFQRAVANSLHRHWKLYLAEGIALLILGVLAILVPPIATLAVTIVLGWLFLISGVMGLATTFMMREAPGFWWALLSGVLAVAVGGLLLAAPLRGAFSLESSATAATDAIALLQIRGREYLDITRIVQQRTSSIALVPAMLEQQPPTGVQVRTRVMHDAADIVEAIGA